MSKKSRLDFPIEHLAPIRMRATASNSRFACYSYLEAVYRQYRSWSKDCGAKRGSRVLSQRHGLKPHRKVHPIRVLITLTHPSLDPKMASRWTRALEYAALADVPPSKLVRFFRRNGGIAGCAVEAARRRPRRTIEQDSWATPD